MQQILESPSPPNTQRNQYKTKTRMLEGDYSSTRKIKGWRRESNEESEWCGQDTYLLFAVRTDVRNTSPPSSESSDSSRSNVSSSNLVFLVDIAVWLLNGAALLFSSVFLRQRFEWEAPKSLKMGSEKLWKNYEKGSERVPNGPSNSMCSGLFVTISMSTLCSKALLWGRE